MQPNKSSEGKKPVVVVLSDAVGDVSDEIKTKYDKDNIQVFSIQMSKGDNGAKAGFADFAKDTGGTNIKIDIGMCGFNAKKEIDSARHTLSSFLGCEDKEVFFTPSGTVANNTAICLIFSDFI